MNEIFLTTMIMEKKNLHGRMKELASEYARQFGEIISMEPEFWVGGDDDFGLCCFGDAMFFSLDEMQLVVDNIDKYVRRYGSKGTVGYEIHEWVDWWLNDCPNFMERVEGRVVETLRPRINLKAWLDGCPKEDVYSNDDVWEGEKLVKLKTQRDVLDELIKEYGMDSLLRDVMEDLLRNVKEEEEEMKKKKHERFVEKMKSRSEL